ncbi:unnamed protein product [Schistosoma curassoni]|uniref:Similar to n=1 Tax=Schistosoma curassoni TaxID=6186 RepID=A0A183KS67_9TREM|nr:unnamed protein product [Schistosoma curassoni]
MDQNSTNRSVSGGSEPQQESSPGMNFYENPRQASNVTPPTIEEARMLIRQIEIGKAAAPDNTPAKVLKSDVEEDLVGGTSATDRLERWIPNQDTKERNPEQMREIYRNHTIIGSRDSF